MKITKWQIASSIGGFAAAFTLSPFGAMLGVVLSIPVLAFAYGYYSRS